MTRSTKLLCVFYALLAVEAQQVGIRLVWVYVVLSFVVAISAVFPIFLVAREIGLARLNRSVGIGAVTQPG